MPSKLLLVSVPLASVVLVIAACQVAADRPALTEPQPVIPASTDGIFSPSPCPGELRNAETGCLQDDVAACCTLAAIPHEYEWLEARKTDDPDEAARRLDVMLELLSHGCDLESEASCVQLDAVAGHRGGHPVRSE
ncbi:MAG: hypothetical protein JKY37_01730 [Nannocystaceae bacterium]|nr:hypothetical protein [Nannocystaceae bacterium]